MDALTKEENRAAPFLVVLSGAGISAESGLKTFRAADGLWEDHPIDEVATPEGFAADATRVHRFYNMRRRELAKVSPNPAHAALGKLEQQLGEDMLIITQNIDDLHERGGSTNVLHMHGELYRMKCNECAQQFECRADLSVDRPCSNCGNKGGLRPDIVWFGEMPYEMERIEQALSGCKLFVAIGTSGSVFPAAGFVLQARAAGALCCEINTESSAMRRYFQKSYEGPASTQVPQFIADFPSHKKQILQSS